MSRSRSLLLLVAFVVHVASSNAQNGTCVDTTQLDMKQDLPYLQSRFKDLSIIAPKRKSYLGGQNRTYCCLKAVNDYLANDCKDGNQVKVDASILDPSKQFPCGASYIGDNMGAPEVQVTYNWTRYNCPGWQISQASKVTEWTQLLVGFILPAVVFSFNIPRPRKLRVWEKFFPEDIASYRIVAGLAGAVGAAVCVSIDTVAWLMISFAFAGPLALSGLYEAQLDKRTLHFLQDQIKHDKLPLALRARILFTILCGNLDMYPAWSDTMDLARHLDNLDKRLPEFRRAGPRGPEILVSSVEYNTNKDQIVATASSRVSATGSPRSPTRKVEFDGTSMASGSGSFDEPRDTDPLSPTTPTADEKGHEFLSIHARDHANKHSRRHDSLSLTRTRTASSLAETEPDINQDGDSIATSQRQQNSSYARWKTIQKITVRLRAMLACQYSFGTTIGGPVVFFLGSFIYALVDIRQNIGDEDIAEALAFGMWWTIIPHIAVVGGLLLAGNNPNILEGIVSIRELRYGVGENLINRQLERRMTIDSSRAFLLGAMPPWQKNKANLLERVYEAEYVPAWMWDRGKTKQDWLLVLFTDSWLKYQKDGRLPRSIRVGLESLLTEAIMLKPGDWVFLWGFAYLLIFIPCLFAFLTAYYTPEIGIACRASTIIVYMGAQTLLLLLWTYYLTWRDKYWDTARKIKRIVQKPADAKSEASLRDLILQLKKQATRDTTIPYSWKLRRSNSTADTEVTDPDSVAIHDQAHPIIKALFYCLCVFGFLVSLLTSIGGTLMQTIGIYRNCLCLLRASEWPHASSRDVYLTLSTNTFEAIHEAQKDWTIIGIFSVVFLAFVAYIGWWYQKRLRATFKNVAEQLDGAKRSRELDDLD